MFIVVNSSYSFIGTLSQEGLFIFGYSFIGKLSHVHVHMCKVMNLKRTKPNNSALTVLVMDFKVKPNWQKLFAVKYLER